MVIYVDIIFLINLVYDFLILTLVNIVLRRGVKNKRVLLGSLVGSISSFSIFIPFLSNIFITIILSVVMLLITFKYKDFIYFKNNFIYFYMISVIFGGFLYFINIKFNNYIYNQNIYYQNKILINFIGIIFISPIVAILYLYTYKNNLVNNSNYYDLVVSLNDKIHKIKAFYDTGNLVKDPYKGRPVILINKEVLYGDIKNKSPIYVPCHMINNLVMIECYKPSLLIINNHIINNCLIGLWNKTNFYDGINGIISGYIGDKIR